MADGYSRISGKHGVCTAQNGPGITNFVTGRKTACNADGNHSHSDETFPLNRMRNHCPSFGLFWNFLRIGSFSVFTHFLRHCNSFFFLESVFLKLAEFPVCITHCKCKLNICLAGIAAAYWAHSPVVVFTPEAGTLTKGHGGFQEVDQLPLFEVRGVRRRTSLVWRGILSLDQFYYTGILIVKGIVNTNYNRDFSFILSVRSLCHHLTVLHPSQPITKYQGHVNNPLRVAEIANRAFDIALSERGPTQINVPRDYLYHEGGQLVCLYLLKCDSCCCTDMFAQGYYCESAEGLYVSFCSSGIFIVHNQRHTSPSVRPVSLVYLRESSAYQCDFRSYLTPPSWGGFLLKRCVHSLFRINDYLPGEYQIPAPSVTEKGAGGPKSILAAVELIRHAKNPVILGKL